MHIYMEEWLSLSSSGTGERAIFNRDAARKLAERNGRRDSGYDFGCNPCSEIILRPNQFCNLTEVVVRPTDTVIELTEKVACATILGILQSTLTDFKFLGKEWKENCEEERLLGVSLTGIMDNPVLNNMKNVERTADWYGAMKKTAIKEAKSWSKALNINMPTAITCVKPSGTVSQLVNSASGLHSRHSEYYIRRVRVAKSDPVSNLLIDSGVPYHPENGFTIDTCNTLVFEFPVQSPKGSVFRDDRTALEQLEMWKLIQEHWCEHKPSCTVYVKEDEWLEVGAWVYKNWDIVSGIAFLPHDGGVYQLPPYSETDRSGVSHVIDFDKLKEYESEDYTSGSKEYACTGNSCDI
jgi:ribonucleoside-triphosphate reductase